MASFHGLSDCVLKDAAQTELFLIQEGPAVDCARRVRDRLTQAVLPLAASMVRISGTRLDRVLLDESVQSIIAALGVGIQLPHETQGTGFGIGTLRYGKLIIVTEPTEQGRRLRDQIVSFLFRFNRPVLKSGRVHVYALPRGQHVDDADFERSIMSSVDRILTTVTTGRSMRETLSRLEV